MTEILVDEIFRFRLLSGAMRKASFVESFFPNGIRTAGVDTARDESAQGV